MIRYYSSTMQVSRLKDAQQDLDKAKDYLDKIIAQVDNNWKAKETVYLENAIYSIQRRINNVIEQIESIKQDINNVKQIIEDEQKQNLLNK